MPVVIGVAPTLADRVRLAELLDGFGPVGLVLVSTLDEARRMLDGAVPGTTSGASTGTAAGPPVEAEQPGAGSPNGHGRIRRLAGLLVDSDQLLAGRNGEQIRLTPLEHDLLVCLGSEPRQTWSHAALHEAVWNTRHVGGQADIHSVVKRLRRKLAELGAGATITAVRGVGFRLSECPSAGLAGAAGVGTAAAGTAGVGTAAAGTAGVGTAGVIPAEAGRAGAGHPAWAGHLDRDAAGPAPARDRRSGKPRFRRSGGPRDHRSGEPGGAGPVAADLLWQG